MTEVQVHASRSYRVLIGSGLLEKTGALLSALPAAGKVAVVTDDTVQALYGERLRAALADAGFTALFFVIPHGEASKCADSYVSLLNFLAQSHLTGTDTVLALGGGVPGDLAGFAASTFLRGVRFVQVPTTLLAAVDSSVGGKTAIDLQAGKNLAGAFWQPSLVVCDTELLSTLPPETFADGAAEVIKYGALGDEELFRTLENAGPDFDRESVIAHCVENKRGIVEKDEFDRGERRKLNLGHTFGHGMEKASGYTLTHGKCVAAGMALIARTSFRRGLCDSSVPERMEALLKRFGLPVQPLASREDMLSAALSDKKRAGGEITLVLLKAIGESVLEKVPVEKLEEYV